MQREFLGRIKAVWNAFTSRDPTFRNTYGIGPEDSSRPDRPRLRYTAEKSIVSAIYNRVAVDCSETILRHVRTDENDQFVESILSGLNSCLTLRANIDQTSKAFIQDVVISMFGEGVIAIVPIDTASNPLTGAFDILSMRTGKIIGWFPKHVRLDVYNDNSGRREEITLPKTAVSVVENPFYMVMNMPNSTSQRLIEKLNILDAIDQQSGSGKLDLLVQFPFSIKSETKRLQAEARKQAIEDQLKDSKYGIAWIDATEKVTQLNRPSENNLMGQVEWLTDMLYGQLGITKEILAGTADEKTMLNYRNNTINPIISAITDGIKSSFLTKTARTQFQSVMAFRDPFKYMTAETLATLSDSLTRNEIASSNDMRSVIGWKPSSTAGANDLRNKNLNPATQGPAGQPNKENK